MRIERINENQIRCTLTRHDLTSRDLDLSELAYGSEKARGLFHEMIEQATEEFGFEAEDIPLMVEAVPLSGDSLMLLITKIENPEELDVRFSKFAPSPDELLELDRPDSGPEKQTLDLPDRDKDSVSKSPAFRVYAFPSLDSVTTASRIVGFTTKGSNSLYKSQDNKKYYLVITNEADENTEFYKICNILAEYGIKVKVGYAALAYYEEHLECLIKDRAIQVLASL